MGRWLVLVVVLGCYSPSVLPGAPCGENGACPAGLTCHDGRCEHSIPGDGYVPDQLASDASSEDARGSVDAGLDAPSALGPWSAPIRVPGISVSGSGESDPSWTLDQLTIVFTAHDRIYLGTRSSTADAFTVAPLAELDPETGENYSPEIDATGTTILFTSSRDGDRDVYSSTWTPSGWTPPNVVSELSSPSDEKDVAISPDGLTAVISRDDTLWRATRGSVTSPWGTPVELSGLEGAGPSLNAAGDIYFHSASPRDLFVARKDGDTYLAPIPVAELNTAGRDAAPFVSADDRSLLFEHDAKIYVSTR